MSSLGNISRDHLITRGDFDPTINLTDAFVTRFNYVSTAGQTVFMGTDANGLTMFINPGAEVVYLDGMLLRPTNDYTVSSTTITLTSSVAAGHELVVIVNTAFNVANTYSQSVIDSKDAATLVSANANLSANGNGVAKAWVNFYWTGSAIVIRASFNVSSVVRNATGVYTVNFTNAMPDTNFVASGTAKNSGANALTISQWYGIANPTTSSYTFAIANYQPTQLDPDLFCSIVFHR